MHFMHFAYIPLHHYGCVPTNMRHLLCIHNFWTTVARQPAFQPASQAASELASSQTQSACTLADGTPTRMRLRTPWRTSVRRDGQPICSTQTLSYLRGICPQFWLANSMIHAPHKGAVVRWLAGIPGISGRRKFCCRKKRLRMTSVDGIQNTDIYRI